MTSSRWHAHGNVYLVSEDSALTPETAREQAQGTDGIVQVVRAGDDVLVHFPGGDLRVRLRDGRAWLTGPAELVV